METVGWRILNENLSTIRESKRHYVIDGKTLCNKQIPGVYDADIDDGATLTMCKRCEKIAKKEGLL